VIPPSVTATEYVPQQGPPPNGLPQQGSLPDQGQQHDPPPDQQQQQPPITVTSTEYAPGSTQQPIPPPLSQPQQGLGPPPDQLPQQTLPPNQQIPPMGTGPLPEPEISFTPSPEPPKDVEPAPLFEIAGASPTSAPSVVIPPTMQSPAKCGPNLPACAETYYCDPQPLCTIGKDCPGLCLARFGGSYSQPEDMRSAVWNKAMKEGVYRLLLLVTEVRSAVASSSAAVEFERWVRGQNMTASSAGGTKSVVSAGNLTAMSVSGAAIPVVPVLTPLWSGNSTATKRAGNTAR